MATREMTFIFPNEAMFNEVKEDFRLSMYDDYCDSDKLAFYDYWEFSFRVDIQADCSNIERAASICRRHLGHFVPEPTYGVTY